MSETRSTVIYEVRVENGPALSAFEQLVKKLNDVRFAKANANKLDKEIIKAETEVATAIKLQGVASAEQVKVLASLNLQRDANNRKLAEAILNERNYSSQIRENSNDLAGLTERGERFRDKMAQATLEAIRQSGVLNQLGARSASLDGEVKQVNATLEKNVAQLGELRAAYEKGAKSEQDFARESADLNDAIAEGQKAQEKLGRELEQVKQKAGKLESELSQLEKQYRAGKLSLDEYRAATQRLEDSVGGLSGKFDAFVAGQGKELKSTLGSMALQYAGVGAAIYGAVQIISDAGKTVADFDQGLARVSSLGGQYKASIDALGESARTIGVKFGIGAGQSLSAVEALAKAGVSATDILGGGLEGALTLAASGSLDVGEAAEFAASAMNQFGLNGKDVPRIADLLSAAANKAAGEVSDFGNALKFVGPVAAGLNVPLEDTVGTLALFAQNGIAGEQAGTSLRGVLSALTSPSKMAADEMERLGIVTADGSSKLFDAQGNFLGLANLAEQLQTSTKDLTQEERAAALGRIFGNQQLTAAQILYKGGGAAVNEYTNAINVSGFASQVAADKTNNVVDAAKKAGAAWDAWILSIDKGDGVISRLVKGTLNALADALGDIARQGDKLGRNGAAGGTVGDINKDLKAGRNAINEYLDGVNKLASSGANDTLVDRAQGQVRILLNTRGKSLEGLIALEESYASKVEDARKRVAEATPGTFGAQEQERELAVLLFQRAAVVDAFNAKMAEKGKAEQAAAKATADAANTNADAAKVEVQSTKAVTQAKSDLARQQDELAKQLAQDANQRTVDALPGQDGALLSLDQERAAREAVAKGNAELLLAIEVDYQAKRTLIIEQAAQERQVVQDQAEAGLVKSIAAGREQQLQRLGVQHAREFIETAKHGGDLFALVEKQSSERAALTAGVEAQQESDLKAQFDADYAALDDNLIAQLDRQTQYEQDLANMRAGFREQKAATDAEAAALNEESAARDRDVAAGALDALQQISDAFYDRKISDIDNQNARLQNQLEAAQSDQTKAEIQGQLDRNNARKKGLEDGKKAAQVFAIAATLINTYTSATAAFASQLVPGDPSSAVRATIAAATAIASGLLNVAKITGFAKGGIVDEGWGPRVNRSNGDNVLVRTDRGGMATLRTGEAVLNEEQQRRVKRKTGVDIRYLAELPGYSRERVDELHRQLRDADAGLRLDRLHGFALGGIADFGSIRPDPGTIVNNVISGELKEANDRPIFARFTEFKDMEARDRAITILSSNE